MLPLRNLPFNIPYAVRVAQLRESSDLRLAGSAPVIVGVEVEQLDHTAAVVCAFKKESAYSRRLLGGSASNAK